MTTTRGHRWANVILAHDPMTVVQWCVDCGALWRETAPDAGSAPTSHYRALGSPEWAAVAPTCHKPWISDHAQALYGAIRAAFLKAPDFSPQWRATYALLEQAHAMKEAIERFNPDEYSDGKAREFLGSTRPDYTRTPKAPALLDSLARHDGRKS